MMRGISNSTNYLKGQQREIFSVGLLFQQKEKRRSYMLVLSKTETSIHVQWLPCLYIDQQNLGVVKF